MLLRFGILFLKWGTTLRLGRQKPFYKASRVHTT